MNLKRKKGQKIERYFWEEKNVLLRMEKNALRDQPKIFNIN